MKSCFGCRVALAAAAGTLFVHLAPAAIPDGVHALYFTFRGPHGCGAPDLKSITLD